MSTCICNFSRLLAYVNNRYWIYAKLKFLHPMLFVR